MKKGFDNYREIKVRTASQTSLIVMLYDEMIRYIDHIVENLEPNPNHEKNVEEKVKKIKQINNLVNKTQDILTELMSALDFDKGGDIAKNLFELYKFFSNALTEANIQKTIGDLPGIRKLLVRLREAWAVVDNDALDRSIARQELNIEG